MIPYMQVYKYTRMQLCKYAITQIHKFSSMQVFTNLAICKAIAIYNKDKKSYAQIG